LADIQDALNKHHDQFKSNSNSKRQDGIRVHSGSIKSLNELESETLGKDLQAGRRDRREREAVNRLEDKKKGRGRYDIKADTGSDSSENEDDEATVTEGRFDLRNKKGHGADDDYGEDDDDDYSDEVDDDRTVSTSDSRYDQHMMIAHLQALCDDGTLVSSLTSKTAVDKMKVQKSLKSDEKFTHSNPKKSGVMHEAKNESKGMKKKVPRPLPLPKNHAKNNDMPRKKSGVKDSATNKESPANGATENATASTSPRNAYKLVTEFDEDDQLSVLDLSKMQPQISEMLKSMKNDDDDEVEVSTKPRDTTHGNLQPVDSHDSNSRSGQPDQPADSEKAKKKKKKIYIPRRTSEDGIASDVVEKGDNPVTEAVQQGKTSRATSSGRKEAAKLESEKKDDDEAVRLFYRGGDRVVFSK
jgi:hypothetical protein